MKWRHKLASISYFIRKVIHPNILTKYRYTNAYNDSRSIHYP